MNQQGFATVGCCLLCSVACVAAVPTEDSAAAYNGRVLADLLVAKCANVDGAESAWRFKDAVNWLERREVVVRGSVAEVSGRWFSKGKTIVLTVGRVREQAVNVKLHVRPDAAKIMSSLKAGQDVAFRCRVSEGWDPLSDIVLEDAVLIDARDAEMMLCEARRSIDDLLGDCIVPECPFSALAANRRCELLEMAHCANAAYPENPMPFGYRAMSRCEWEKAVGKCGYSQEVYFDDGYVIFGNGLRGRILVHRLLKRVVIAWSGCDLSGQDIWTAGRLDFMTCAKHLLSGAVESQFEQALAITKGIVEEEKGEIWIVGHSLGGCLTTYISLMLEDAHGADVHCATFNGLGVALPVVKGLSSESRNRGARRLTNVFCTKDPVYNGHRVTSWTGHPPRHFGRSYFIAYRGDPNGIGLADQVIRYHGMDELCCQMRLLCPWYGDWKMLLLLFAVVSMLLLVGCVVWRIKGHSRYGCIQGAKK